MNRPLRVGLIAYGLDRPLSGVTRVAMELARALETNKGCAVTLLRGYPTGGPHRLQSRSVYLPGCRLLPGMMALGGPMVALAASALSLDVVHDPIGISPFTLGRWAGRFRRVVTIHDAIAFENPRGYPWLNNILHRGFVPLTLGNVDAVATDSAHAKQSLTRFLGLKPDRLDVIPLACSPTFHPVDSREAMSVAARHGIDGSFVLYVGAFKQHKNLVGLVEAFARARTRLPRHRLVLIGPSQWEFPALSQRIDELDLASSITVLGYVPEVELPALYAAADVFVLPSFYEGFGMPVLEAMACGTPVVSSNATSLPEVAGDAALLVDPHDDVAIADAIVRVASDGDLAASLRRKGLEHARRYSWHETANAYVDLYRRVVG